MSNLEDFTACAFAERFPKFVSPFRQGLLCAVENFAEDGLGLMPQMASEEAKTKPSENDGRAADKPRSTINVVAEESVLVDLGVDISFSDASRTSFLLCVISF